MIGEYFRRHRFAGQKDRAQISQHIYAVLRRRAAIDWWIGHLGGPAVPSTRLRVLAALTLVEGWSPEAVERACDGDRFRPMPLTDSETEIVGGLAGRSLEHPGMPGHVSGNYPEWLEPALAESFGSTLGEEMAAMAGEAALDLRANKIRGDRATIARGLAAEGVKARPTPLSPLGLRVQGRIPLSTLDSFKSGAVDVQDEGSQVAALLAMARPGMRVVDFCAGAGGKTLALAASMENKGHLVACDVSETRLTRSAQRLRRAGVTNVERRTLSTERDKWIKRHAGGFDRVFVDAPCTGTGTWRRNPDAKWRLDPGDIERLTALQSQILASAGRLVKPGGRLIYATCSFLADENERQVARFLESFPEFALLPITAVWHEALATPCPVETEMLRLTPARHGTDGFFVAVMARRGAEAVTEAPASSDELAA